MRLYHLVVGLILRLLDALAGAGKTRQIALRAKMLSEGGERVLIVQPTIDLNGATEARLREVRYSGPVRVINGSSTCSPADELRSEMNGPDVGGDIVISTHQTFELASPFTAASRFHVFVDEELTS